MYRISREKVKTYILIALIITSLIQVGILWDYQKHGFPTSFLMTIFNPPELSQSETDQIAREEFFRPYRLILSNGDASHWIIDRGDAMYEKVWSGAKEYIKNVVASKPQSSGEDWGRLVTRKGVFLDFKFNMDMNLMKWFLDLGGSSSSGSGPTGIYKVFIIPRDGVTSSLDTIYVLSDDIVYKYIVDVNSQDLNREYFEKYLVELGQGSRYEKKKYWVIKEFDPMGRLSFLYNPDIPCVVETPLGRNYNRISYSVPDKITDGDQNVLARVILANEQYNYDRTIGMEGNIIFKNQDSIYRIYNNGLIEYKYISSTERSDKEEIGKAFSNANGFISRLGKSLIPKSDTYLSNVRVKNGNVFEFTFNYVIDNIPVFVEYKPQYSDGRVIRDAIVVEADSNRVLSCTWLVRNIDKNGKSIKYSIGFNSLDKRVLDRTKPAVGDISAAYVISSTEQKELDPSWVIESTAGERSVLPLTRIEGE